MSGVPSIWEYEGIANRDVLEDIELLGTKLAGQSVQHVNSTYSGGGVAEILNRLVPLMKGLGIDASWNVIRGDDPFFTVTKYFHNALHGKIVNEFEENAPPIRIVRNGMTSDGGLPVLDTFIRKIQALNHTWSEAADFSELYRGVTELTTQLNGAFSQRKDMLETYLKWNEINAQEFSFDEDVVFIHDPQPAAMIAHYESTEKTRWVWRCHIDVSSPDQFVWKFLRRFVERYDASIFSTPGFSRVDLSTRQFLVPPSIDPLSDKNKELPEKTVTGILDKFGIDSERPIITQISRFDYFKDPAGVIESYKMVKKHIDCQLILAGSLATDDPEGQVVYDDILTKAGNDPDIHLLLLPPFSDIEINALQRASTVILQKSVKEGFGLTVSEALWKGKPVIAGATGGIPLQVINGVTGFLTHSIEGAAYKIRYLFRNPEFAQQLGENGREHVRHNFLITRHLRDYLDIMVCLQDSSSTIYL